MLCSGPSWISARLRSHHRTGLEWAIWVTRVSRRREDRSSISFHPLADLISGSQRSALLRLDVRGPDHLAPLFGFCGDQLAEVDGRARKHSAAQFGKPCLHFGIFQCGVDFLVELADDLGGRIPWSTEAAPEARLEAREELAQGWNVGKNF